MPQAWVGSLSCWNCWPLREWWPCVPLFAQKVICKLIHGSFDVKRGLSQTLRALLEPSSKPVRQTAETTHQVPRKCKDAPLADIWRETARWEHCLEKPSEPWVFHCSVQLGSLMYFSAPFDEKESKVFNRIQKSTFSTLFLVFPFSTCKFTASIFCSLCAPAAFELLLNRKGVPSAWNHHI